MTRIINCIICAAIVVMAFSCKPNNVVKYDELPSLPMKAVHEHSLAYAHSQKIVHESKLLSDMETMGNWEHGGSFWTQGIPGTPGSLTLSAEKPYKGKYSLLLEASTKGPIPPGGGRPWGASTAVFKVDNEDWTDWNRITFWIYPDMPGFKVICVNMTFYNDGVEKLPSNGRNGSNFQILENQKWNKVNWEIDHLGRDKVTRILISYRLQGNEPGATDKARFFIDEAYFEKVDADHFEGWEVQPGEIAYNHAGYTNGYPKMAFTTEAVGEKFTLKDQASGNIVKNGVVAALSTPAGSFQMMDFSDIKTEGTYVLEVGKLKTKPFTIGTFSDVYRSSIIKTINHFYTQRCGIAIPGIHDICHLDWLCTHDDKSVPIHGGWHDAGDLSQGLINTAEAAYSMMMLAEKLKVTDPVLADRLLEEAEWGLSWVLRTRFGDGFRNVWATKDMWTDGINGSQDDSNSAARKDPHANLISATTEAFAAIAFKKRNPFLASQALQCAIEDYKFGLDIDPNSRSRMNVQIAGAALNAALALYEATSDNTYKKSATEHASYLISCQQQENLAADVPLKGFFHRSPEKNAIFHYSHQCFEQNLVVGLVKLAQLFPTEAAEWKKAISLYADFYKEICNYTAPYYMIPAGVYDLTQARNEVDTLQIMSGIRLNERYYMKRFPVWGEMRGNSGTTLTQAKGLATIAKYLQDKTLLDITYRALDWHLGVNPFTQSLMYGEGYRFATQYTALSGNLVGGLPVGVQTHNNGDLPYWPAENCYNWKEIWVHPSSRWLMLASDLL
jgi:Glycosyl hydrolase family 9./N-terminal ig-like domain of cellulase.